MKILMLGWEYPPHIAGGLGVACEGMTKALSAQGEDITFVVPKLYGEENAHHMNITDPKVSKTKFKSEDIRRAIETISLPTHLMPYWNKGDYQQSLAGLSGVDIINEFLNLSDDQSESSTHYGLDLIAEVKRYSARIIKAFADKKFDIIHAHDWMTFPAAVALAQLTGTPLVVHLHSLEVDRSGAGKDQDIVAIEALGINHANQVIAVSQYTKNLIINEFGTPADKISVVYNGIYRDNTKNHYRKLKKSDYLVLFLGRVTFQKGPDYFIKAAAKVAENLDNVRFAIAGSGDMLEQTKNLADQLGIADKVNFLGFVRKDQQEETYAQADLYVMPSVSEPFGITALEAVSFDTPVILSKQSGVAEVLGNALKADFWNTDRLADLIINALIHEELHQELASMAKKELEYLRWDISAEKIRDIYRSML